MFNLCGRFKTKEVNGQPRLMLQTLDEEVKLSVTTGDPPKMSLNTSILSAKVAAVGVTLSQAATIVQEVISLIEMAEHVYEDLKGDEKFQAVLAGLETVLHDLNLSDKVDAIKKAVGPIISLIVKIYNLKNLWSKPVSTVTSTSSSS